MPKPDAGERLTQLANSLEQHPGEAVLQIEDLRLALDSWDFVRGAPMEVNPSPDTTFHVLPDHSHLQLNVVGKGLAHPELVRKVIGRIQERRVHL